MEKNDIYLEMLKKQFCEAKGYNKFDNNSKEMLQDLESYIRDRHRLGDKYADFLRYIGVDITTEKTAEINKGKYDSIIKSYNTLAITPYPIDIPENRLYNYSFVATENGPKLEMKTDDEKLYLIADMPIKNYMTQNPYNLNQLRQLKYLYNSDKYNIIVGMFGKIYDYNMNIKLKQLEKLEKQLKDLDYKTAFLKDNFNYYSVLYTNVDYKKM